MKHHVEFDLEFRKNPYGGLYICIEGIDGSGKTTQVKRVGEHFIKLGREVVLTREPSDEGDIGMFIREVLQSKKKLPPTALQFLFSADRNVHHENFTEPALRDGKVVVSDRCFWSVIPYGIMDREGDAYKKDTGELLLIAQGLLSHYHQFIVPDYTFYLDISVDNAMKRLSHMHKAEEIYETREKLEKIVQGYKWLIKQFPEMFIMLDGNQPVEQVTAEIIAKLPK